MTGNVKVIRIRRVEGPHLTAANRRHLAEIISKGWSSGHSRLMFYSLSPIEGSENRFRYCIRKRELSDFGKPQVRESRGVIEVLRDRSSDAP